MLFLQQLMQLILLYYFNLINLIMLFVLQPFQIKFFILQIKQILN